MGLDQFLIASALDPDVLRRLEESSEEVFATYGLNEEERDLIRKPDHRLLAALGAAVLRQQQAQTTTTPTDEPPQPTAPAPFVLPPARVALTIVPCLNADGIRYAIWVNPLADGADPASLPAPVGAAYPGQPLAPLHSVIRLDPLPIPAPGGFQVGLSASFERSSNMVMPPQPVVTAQPDSAALQHAVAAVRQAPPGEKYRPLLDLIQLLKPNGAPTR